MARAFRSVKVWKRTYAKIQRVRGSAIEALERDVSMAQVMEAMATMALEHLEEGKGNWVDQKWLGREEPHEVPADAL